MALQPGGKFKIFPRLNKANAGIHPEVAPCISVLVYICLPTGYLAGSLFCYSH